MRLLAAFSLLLVGLAGCSDASGDDPTEDDSLFEDVSTSSGKGLIRGVVVDTAIIPVPDADVTLVGQSQSTTSDANGAFVFTDLDPGAYFIKVSKPGWNSVQQNVEVVADVEKPPIVRILMEFIPGSEPRAETLHLEGFIKCGLGTPATFTSCDIVFEDDVSTVSLPFEGQPDHIQVETTWRSTQAASEQLYLVYYYCSDSCGSRGDRWDEGNRDDPHVARHSTPLADNEVAIYASPGGPANGTGTSIEQRFDVYVTLFYNIAEPDEDWTFLESGAYQT